MKDPGMQRVLRFLIRLYPAWWRRRYGQELEALLEDSRSGSRDAWDLFRGAMEIQMSRWSFGKIVTVCGIVGVMLASFLAFSTPYRYRSTAILKSTPGRSAEDWNALNRAAFTPQALSNIIDREHLYAGRPTQDTIDRMRRGIRIEPVDPSLVRVSFSYEDPVQAQRVSQELVDRLITSNLLPDVSRSPIAFQLVVPADQPKRQIERKRYGLAGLGLPAGMLFGVVLALILRWRRIAAS
jgi:uncharacterized protein involved in exopolysaccharide biosynthesis